MARKNLTPKQERVRKRMLEEKKRKAAINKRKAKERIIEINKIADQIQKKSGSKTKVEKKTVYKKSRRKALKEAGRIWKKKH